MILQFDSMPNKKMMGVRFTDEEKLLITKIAKVNGASEPEAVRQLVRAALRDLKMLK